MAATRALNSIMFGLVHHYPEDEFSAIDMFGVETFIDKKGHPLNTPPRWHEPSPAEVSLCPAVTPSSPCARTMYCVHCGMGCYENGRLMNTPCLPCCEG